jgi:hypothetical protein
VLILIDVAHENEKIAPAVGGAVKTLDVSFQPQSRASTTRQSSQGDELGERDRSYLGTDLRARRRSRCEHPGQDRGRFADKCSPCDERRILTVTDSSKSISLGIGRPYD